MSIPAVFLRPNFSSVSFQKKEKEKSNPISNPDNNLSFIVLNPQEKANFLDFNNLKMTQMNITVQKYSKNYNGVQLLKQHNFSNTNEKKYKNALETIKQIGQEKLTSTKPLPKLEKQNPTFYSLTSEFTPIKEGGLGVVPPALQDNFQKLGINMPTFTPMYLKEGYATFTKNNSQYEYTFKNKKLELEKLITIKMDVYKNGNQKTIPVTFFLNTQKDENNQEKQLILVKADNYFDGTIYEGNTKTEEPEKFAIFSKAVYEFTKIKMDGLQATKDIEIHSSDAFEKIEKPDGMILNDWHASPTAALLRYKAVMENANGALSDETAEKLKDMRILTIGHNAIYQGSTRNNNNIFGKKAATQNILNTLFDEYTYDIVSNSLLDIKKLDNDLKNKKYANVLLLNYSQPADNYTNLLNMGIILSDYFTPVSKNYSKELVSPEHKKLSYELQFALIQKNKAGKLIGVINGNDFDKINIKAKHKDIINQTGVTFETYDKTDSIQQIQEKRLKNKINFYNNFILPYSNSQKSSKEEIEKVKNLTSKLEFYSGEQSTTMPILSDEELKNTPILTSGGRLVSQKGIDILCDAIKMLFENWEKDFPNKNKPIFYIVGTDGEKGTQRKIIEELKDKKLSKEDNNRVLFGHGFAPLFAMNAASDFFLMPSKFEPCGLAQGEALALATPVIASNVGGITDTVNRQGKINGILTDGDKELNAQTYYEAMKKGLKIYFEDKLTYQNMVKNSINEDFSWIQKDKKGPIYEYLELLGVNKENLVKI